jgi:hypothetical protein
LWYLTYLISYLLLQFSLILEGKYQEEWYNNSVSICFPLWAKSYLGCFL